MNILIVLSAVVDINIRNFIDDNNINYIVAVDGGINHLDNEQIKPNIVIGDMDSTNVDISNFKKIKLNTYKDETDYQEALKYVKNKFNSKIQQIYVIGFVSSFRLEHFYANINMIEAGIKYVSNNTSIYLLEPGKYKVDFNGYISFFAKEDVYMLTLENFKYNLKDYNLTVNDNLTISNELLENEYGKITFEKGKLLVFESMKD